MQRRRERKPIRLALALILLIMAYVVAVLVSDSRFRRHGGQVGLTSEVFLFRKGSVRDWFGYAAVLPWSHAVGLPVYWYEWELPEKPGQPIRVKYHPD